MFGLGKKKKTEDSVESVEKISEAEETVAEGENESPAEFSRENGPWDEEEKEAEEGYLDFGSMKIRMSEGLNMRLDVEQKSKQMVAVTLTKDNNSLQVQAFAAPKSTGLWNEIRHELAESVRRQGGSVEVRDGALGREMVSRIPAQTKDGRKGFRVARFVGVDGPRWFLRGVFSGDAALKPEQAQEMEELFKSIVVVRGEDPRPPRELLPMSVPESIRAAQESKQQEQKSAESGLEMPRRGPEIAEIR